MLTTMGISYEDAKSTLRVGLSTFTPKADLELAMAEIVAAVNTEPQRPRSKSDNSSRPCASFT
ncbi:hypothetical protein MES5069_190011 [Mesorhizobium escarrei]|uniref:Cysteine desulfurase n=1 Tax=Mesorhizobium escarrei TaxID=666018 RepID=A0ABM9DN50_9HYPH|nr:hypothetical protein MES5069_190011 [Mesorhizobium escarrei]